MTGRESKYFDIFINLDNRIYELAVENYVIIYLFSIIEYSNNVEHKA